MESECRDATHVPVLTFSFRARTPPSLLFAFPPQPLVIPENEEYPSYPRKRARPLADIDGLDFEIRDYTKKRRLRLKLITSRLSEPFAVPPTNILERGNCPRVALWAKTRAAGRSALRKAAILNKIKRDAMAAREAQERQVEIARRQFRERLAAAAHSSFQRSNVVQYHRPAARRKNAAAQQNASNPTKPPKEGKSTHKRVLPGGKKPIGQSDPYDNLPSFRRPPSPPSESELSWQRRNMGLDINCY
ncbi:hypothetical protein BDD12DRAFT_809277 [Trichophaea hybrida]|nr:hypothetical protein BDD12DRAFT_809277 [Trichophaea hybrida]